MDKAVTTTKPVYGPDDLLNTPQAADYVHYSKSTLCKLRALGGGPVYYQRKSGGLIHYKPRDLDTWIDGSKRRSASAPVPTKQRRRKARG